MTTHMPVLITWDIDPNDYFTVAEKREALQAALTLCKEEGVAATFFFVAQEAAAYPEEIAEMKRAGHEVGCHGLTHGDEEEYNKMSEAHQSSYIEQATALLEDQTGQAITAFRGPRVKISATTLKLLANRGYLTDSSVCSQRLDVVSSNLINTGWLVAPRSPYTPHPDSPFKRGDLDILEVPVSALMLPFISTSLYVLKLAVLKKLFWLLYVEALRQNKPIVYLAHPEEFGPQAWGRVTSKNWLTHGLMFRKRLNERDPRARLALNRELFRYMASFPGVEFMTMKEYALQFMPMGEYALQPHS